MAYLTNGWQVELGIQVGVCGLVDTHPVHRILEFLSVSPKRAMGKITQDVAMESVEAVYSV